MTEHGTLLIAAEILLLNLVYGLASPILPEVLEKRGISEVWIGVIFAFYAASGILTCILVGPWLEKTGHVRMMGFGGLLFAVCSCLLGLILYVETRWLIIALASLLRVGQGAGNSMIGVSAYSYVSVASRSQTEIKKGISRFETAVGIGCTVSPIIGSIVEEKLGFSAVYYIFGGLMIPITLLQLVYLKEPKTAGEEIVAP